MGDREVLRACHCCGLIQWLPRLGDRDVALCGRCGSRIVGKQPERSPAAARCLAAALGGLVLYFPAILLPILEIEKLGHRHQASLLSGTIDLILDGNWIVGVVVLVFSIIFPLAKLLILIELSYLELVPRRHRAWMYRLVEWTGRWSMLDVLLLALLVSLVKLGDMVAFHVGPAVIAFVLCVAMSMIASTVFDPHAMWEEEESRS
ncbi:MAG: paraquat-inducible protein [Pirellulaceae bacterium]|nr:MAG: paraquat-inducible protein [Pirellulaceae bacterium]